MIIVDASVVVTALVSRGESADRARDALTSSTASAPEVLDLEVLSALRRLSRAGSVDAGRASAAARALTTLPIERVAHRPLVPRIWELRDSISTYDAAYVALAELRGAALTTFDGRLARSHGASCRFVLLD